MQTHGDAGGARRSRGTPRRRRIGGALRVTFVASAAREILPPSARVFASNIPKSKLILTEAQTAQQIAKIHADEADVGFVIPPLRDADGLSVEVLAKNQMVAALPEHIRSRSFIDCVVGPRVRTLDHFSSAARAGLHERVLTACAQAGFVPRVGQEASQMDTIASLVAGGMGVALVTRHHRDRQPARCGVFAIFTGNRRAGRIRLAIAYAARRPLLDAFTAVIRSRPSWAAAGRQQPARHRRVRRLCAERLCFAVRASSGPGTDFDQGRCRGGWIQHGTSQTHESQEPKKGDQPSRP